MTATVSLSQFFNSDVVTLPVGGFDEKKETFDVFLARIFARYIELSKQLEDPGHPTICLKIKACTAATESLCEKIISALKHYLRGFPSKAYRDIEESLGLVDVMELTASLGGGSYRKTPKIGAGPIGLREGVEFVEASLQPPLYRIREDDSAATSGELSGKDIFHVPFEKRHLVRNERYSIAGIPCLYLGSSTWVCWDELGRPALDGLFVSLFHFAEDVSVLDFQLPPINAWNAYRAALLELAYSQMHKLPVSEFSEQYGQTFIESYILALPLIAACSIKNR